MKILIQAFFASLIIHLIYFLVVGLVGLIKTLTYKPNLSINQNSVSLQNNVSFGSIDVSNPYPYSFIGAIIIFYLLLKFVYVVKKAT